MTTSTIAASNFRAGAGLAKVHEGAATPSQGFSTVLSLRLGMGLNAAVGEAQFVRAPAQEVPANTDQSGGTLDTEETPSTRTDEPAEIADSPPGETATAAEVTKSEPPASPAEQGTIEPVGMDVAELKGTGALDAPQEKAVGAADVNQLQKSASTQSATETTVASEVRKLKSDAGLRTSAGSDPRMGGVGGVGEGGDRAEQATTEPAGASRDPLGLIHERPNAAEATRKPSINEQEAPSKTEVSGDVFAVRVGEVEPARARFADSVEGTTASRAASAGAVPVANAPGVPQGFAHTSVSRPALAGVSGVGSTGGTGVGGTGVGSGGGGMANEFGGLFNTGGRAFGVAFGAAVRAGKGAVGVAGATKGESKEQIQAQISRGLAAALRQKGGVMSLRLNPEHLGSMKIDLTIENGRVTAVFDAQSEQARQVLREGVDGLKRSIEQAGLVVKGIEVVGVSTLSVPEATRQGESLSHGNMGEHRGGEQGGGGNGGDGEPRDGGAHAGFAGERAVMIEDGPGGVWTEADGSASGLLRLRVDAVV